MGVIFKAFLSLLPIYNQLSNLKNQMIACVLGVSVLTVAIVGFGIKAIKFILNQRYYF